MVFLPLAFVVLTALPPATELPIVAKVLDIIGPSVQ
jgi:hypothetical protein